MSASAYLALLLQASRDAATLRAAAASVCWFKLPEMATTFLEAERRIKARVWEVDGLHKQARQFPAADTGQEALRRQYAADQLRLSNEMLTQALEQVRRMRWLFSTYAGGGEMSADPSTCGL
jgi:hypothetical protein